MADARKPPHRKGKRVVIDGIAWELSARATPEARVAFETEVKAAKGRLLAVATDKVHGARKSPLRYLPQFAIALVVLASLGLGACANMRELKLALDNAAADSKKHDVRSWYDHKERWGP